MRRRGPSREFSELRSCSGKKTVESCRNKRDADKFVFIDLECEDVIDIDYLESLQAKSRGSSTLTKDRKFKSSSFINIDDDDDDDNDEDNYASPVITVEDVGDLDSDADATSSKCSFPASSKSSVTSDGGDCHSVQEKGYTVEGSKCKQTHYGEAPSRNCYGFGFESESCSSDSDYSDCELIEGSYGKLHQYWEKVSQKRKHVVHNGQSGSEGQVSGSGSHSDTHANAEVENRTAPGYVPVCSSSKNGNYEKENLPHFTGTRDGHTAGSSLDPQMDGSFVESNQNVTKEDPLIYEWQSFQTNGMAGEGPSNHDRVELRCKDDEFHDDPSSSEEKDKAVSGQPFDETQMESGFAPPEDKLGAVHEKTFSQEKASAISEEVSLGSTSCHETSSNQGGFHSAREKELCDLRDQLPAEDGYVSPVRRDISIVESDIITDREKHKETAEYKRAIEEEMASRQRVLQIQAEEAQRLRKRRKAENMRLLDMHRRQKQRVEEVRESQKKDEENINLKDQLRAEVRKELKRLELTCIDMASLLRGLGIQVGAGFRPLPNEVHAAYKRALLKFHPDRASRSDIRQQVEAEEKFKLISRMKEKLLLISCY